MQLLFLLFATDEDKFLNRFYAYSPGWFLKLFLGYFGTTLIELWQTSLSVGYL